jgi:ParB family chromosome partitioning protein
MARELEYVEPEDVVIIGLDTDDDDRHPLYDNRIHIPIDESLVRNILVYGVLEPVLVRLEGGRPVCVDGRQRTRCAREAKKRQEAAGEFTVKVPVRRMTGDDGRMAGIMIAAQLRQDDDILTRAQKAAKLLSTRGDLDEVAIAFGRTREAVQGWFKLLEADPVIHKAIRDRKLSASAAVEMSRLPREEQAEALEALLAKRTDRPASVAQAQLVRLERDETAQNPKKAHSTRSQVGIKRSWLRAALGTKVAGELQEPQLAVLRWFAFGEAIKDDWFEVFRVAAEEELTNKVTRSYRRR